MRGADGRVGRREACAGSEGNAIIRADYRSRDGPIACVYYPRSFLKFILLGFLLVSLPLLYALAELILSLDRLAIAEPRGGAAVGAGRAHSRACCSSRRRRSSASCAST